MTTETKTFDPSLEPIESRTNSRNTTSRLSLSSSLEERKGNAVKSLSLRPIRSVKKNLSLKPLGLKSR